VRRRDLIGGIIGSATAWPLATLAQRSEGMRRLGILLVFPESDPEPRRWVTALVESLRELGWTAGGNIQIDYRWVSTDIDRINKVAAELIELKPDVILTAGPLPVVALQQMTSNIPIVFLGIADPVSSGFVASLAHPGGNITGFALGEFTMSGKLLEVLKQVAPQVSRVVVMYNPLQVPQVGRLASIQTAAPSLGIQVTAASATNTDQITQIIENFGRETDGGMIVLPSPVTIPNRGLIVASLARRRVPAVYEYPVFAREGGLVSYGPDPIAQYRQAASYVDRILKGAKPADLPVQQPTKFILAVNLKAAKALGLTLSESFLSRADEVID
jgi:putative tryptophan/tyrosine transport system substrate-binding protein